MNQTPSDSDTPTDSHALAATATTAVKTHDQEALDMGWHEHPQDMAQPLIEGVNNDEIWILVRRFNKQLFHVKETKDVQGNLDLHIADEEEFAPDKMRANIERLYMTVVVGVLHVVKHVARLRSWNEQRRTASFCVTYFTAWFLDMLMPLLFATLGVLILYPPSRSFLFPPMPLALVDSDTGHIQRPRAGHLGSGDTVTGAPEKHPGEAVEQEASNFVTGFASIALSSATETRAEEDDKMDNFGKVVPDAHQLARAAVDAQEAAAGDPPHVKHDKTKTPMQEAMWQQARPVMHALADVCDTWERLGNALSPTPPFPGDVPRYRLAGVIAPLLLTSLFVDSAMVVKGSTFSAGALFFGWPVIWRAVHWLNLHYPKWQRLLEIRNTILSGVPTNAQLALTLLRIGEAKKAPLPPPPLSTTPPPTSPEDAHMDADDVPLDVTQSELDLATKPVSSPESGPEQKKGVKGSRLLGFLKGTTRTGVSAVLSADRLKAAAGAQHARDRLGILPRHVQRPLGPVDFSCRYKGQKGRLYVLTTAATPCVAFAKEGGSQLKPVWSVAVEDIVELKKIGGVGWKAKLVIGWATDREVADALQIVDGAGNKWTLTAMQMRDELFNRLIAMGSQKWEMW
ncbi:hypothetical protein AURDEDRAFT_140476 [Auricularia subglabra TFB-10046 SS5]|uniref:Uncharacterized protein n=1 Tax=Auricularia subglabra (strain TFB-10046 / SS5) TaxID=717982 RepID=J0CWE9_AURST|nr:hypothetical protein AURDEDRAFT_140476 [Auricularia subglabra TFB-10046 SS5]